MSIENYQKHNYTTYLYFNLFIEIDFCYLFNITITITIDNKPG